MKISILVLMAMVPLMVISMTSDSYAQFTQTAVPQDLNCQGCHTISSADVESYKKDFAIILWTDQTTFDHDSIITMNGHLRPENTFHPIIITVTNPIGNIVAIEQIEPQSDGDFQFTLNTSGPLWNSDGQYIIKAQSGSENRSFRTAINIISLDLGEKSECAANEIVVPADNTGVYCIPYMASGETTGVEGFLNTQSKTLILDFRGRAIDSITLDIPRYILDSQSGGVDAPFIVLQNGLAIDAEEVPTTFDDMRKLKIDIPPDQRGKIEIIGTSVVPEFGTIAMLILVVAITSIVIATKRNFAITRV